MSSADGTLSNLKLGLALPLTAGYEFDTVFGYAVFAPGVRWDEIVATLTMPFYGDILFQGSIHVGMDRAGVQQVDVGVNGALSVPAATTDTVSSWRTEGNATAGYQFVPLSAAWSGVAAGAAVSIRAFVQNGYGAPNLYVERMIGFVYCTKT